jgi:hypothetical protein
MSDVRRIPIAESVEKDDVVQAAYELNLDINNRIEGSETRPKETIYNVRGKPTFLHYIEDTFLGFPYIAVSGENANELAERVAKHIQLVSREDLVRGFAASPSDPVALKRLLGHAFLLAPTQFDPKFDAYFHAGFTNKSPEVRRLAVVGVGYVGWPELAKPLRDLAENDPDADVRRDARAMLNALEEGA